VNWLRWSGGRRGCRLHVILPKLKVAPRVTDSGGLLWRAFHRGDRFRRDTATPLGDCGTGRRGELPSSLATRLEDDATPFQAYATTVRFTCPMRAMPLKRLFGTPRYSARLEGRLLRRSPFPCSSLSVVLCADGGGLTRGRTRRGPASVRRPSRLLKSKTSRRRAACIARLTCVHAVRRSGFGTWALAARVNLWSVRPATSLRPCSPAQTSTTYHVQRVERPGT